MRFCKYWAIGAIAVSYTHLEQGLDSIPFFFAYFVPFHDPYVTILATCTQYLGFKTDSRRMPQ